MDRETLLAHLRRTHFAPGDRDRALADARNLADAKEYMKQIVREKWVAL